MTNDEFGTTLPAPPATGEPGEIPLQAETDRVGTATATRDELWLVQADPAELARLRALRPTPALVRTKTP